MVGVHPICRGVAAVLLVGGLFGGLPSASAATTQTSDQTYIVLYNQSAVPADSAASVARAGGRLVDSYDAIGVAVATSNNANFRTNVRQDARVQDAAATAKGLVRLKDRVADNDDDGAAASSLANPNDLTDRQWDMRQIRAPQAHRITGGSRSVLVGDIDTGLDYKHPQLKANIDFASSVSCIGGKANQSPAAWNDDNGHGTHTAGTIAAGSNGFGIVGVAPKVRIAAIKAGDAEGFFFPEAVVCAFMWAGTHHMNVTNNSYFADPFYYNCPSDPEQRAILTAETRAIRFAQHRGVAVIAAAGNFADDLANPTLDRQSPDAGPLPPVMRPVDRSCIIVPTTVPGVILVSADGNKLQKSFYSNYGFGFIDVTAPGGDSILQVTPEAVNGRVLSTWPANLPPFPVDCRPSRKIVLNTDDGVAAYCYLQGTSMAAPHAVGVAALIVSTFGDRAGPDDEDGTAITHMRRLIRLSTDPIACPSATVVTQYAFFPSVNNDAVQKCVAAGQYNSWYGYGQINALKAVTAGEQDD